MKLSVIIPAYNEEKSIKRIVTNTYKILIEFFGKTEDFEIIIMNDGSKDNTLKYCEEMKKEIKNMNVFSNPLNFGKTLNLIRGFDIAKGECVGFIDADYQYDPLDIPKLFEKIKEGYDVVCGNRQLRKDSIYRKFLSFGFNFFNRYFFGIKISDVNCGLKIIKKNALPKIQIKYLKAKWFIDTEFLVRAYEKKLKITELSINHYDRTEGVSKVSGVKLALETFFYGILLKNELLIQRIKNVFCAK